MGEIENLVGVLREVKRQRDDLPPQFQAEIADLVRDLGVPGGVPGRVPGVDAALAALAQNAPPPEWSYRRLLVVAALVKAIESRFGRREPDCRKVVDALRPLTRDGSRGQAAEVHELLCELRPQVEPERDPGVMKRTILACVFALHLVDVVAETMTATVAAPGDATRVRLLGTAALPGYGLDNVSELLDPTMWNHLSGGILTMTPDPDDDPAVDGERYFEVFKVTERLKLTPWLQVVQSPRTTDHYRAQWLEYRLADSQSPGELVTRDQGSIVIRETPQGVCIATTKRVRLTPPFDAPSLAMQADALGYFDAFENMVRVALAEPCKQRVV